MTTTAKPKIYVESSAISYLTARPTEEPITKAKQILTHMWWERRGRYELFISQMVIDEIGRGNSVAADLRLDIAKDMPKLAHNELATRLALALLGSGIIPPKEEADAYHVAIASVHNMDVLLTWNQKHIATNAKRRRIENLVSSFDLRAPQLLTPEQHLILEGDIYDRD